LSAEQSLEVLQQACGDSMRAKLDYAMLALLFGCGFRRSEMVGLDFDDIQMRQGHWAVVDLIGKDSHLAPCPFRTGSKPLSTSVRRKRGRLHSDGFIERAPLASSTTVLHLARVQ
jgi:site-specific recombinase XerC